MGELYGILPSRLLELTPGELYLNLAVTFDLQRQQEPSGTPQPRGADDTTLRSLLGELRAAHG